MKDQPLVKCDIVKFLSYEVKWEVSGGVAVVARFNGKSTCRRRLKKPLSYRSSKGEGCFFFFFFLKEEKTCMPLLVRTRMAACWEVSGPGMFVI